MPQRMDHKDQEILSIIQELTKAVRCCRQDGICCEDISITQFTILDAIAGCRELDMSMLSKILSVDKSTTTRLVAPLIMRNLVFKEKSRKDLRMVLLTLTKEGRMTHKRIRQCLSSFVRAVQSEIPDNKKEMSIEGVRIFLRALQNVSERHPEITTIDARI